jgi:uncharacterized protein (TIGR02147 family)
MNEQTTILKSYYTKKKRDGSRLSLRAVAKKMGVSVTLLSLVIQGKRRLPIRLLDPLCQYLDIDQVDRDKLLKELIFREGGTTQHALELVSRSLDAKSAEKKKPSALQWETLAKKDSEFLADWMDIAIFLTSGLKKSEGSPEWVSRKLFLELGLVNRRMRQLEEAGFLVRQGEELRPAKRSLQIRSGKDFAPIRAYHKAHLENAIQTLEQNTSEFDLYHRFITGMTLTVSKKSISRFKQKIQDFLLEFAEECAQDEAEEVYQMAVQFFPVSQVSKEDKASS